MSIVFPLSLPAEPAFNSFRWISRANVGLNESPYTFGQEVQVWPGQRWEAEVGLPPLTKDQVGAWRAFMRMLNGMQGTFLMGDPNFKAPRGSARTAPGTPTVDGAHAAMAAVLKIAGAPGLAAGYLLAGDYLQVGSGAASRLHMVMKDIDTDSAGEAEVDIWPRLRGGLAGGETVVLTNCRGVFRMRGNEMTDEARPRPVFSMGFSCVEAL